MPQSAIKQDSLSANDPAYEGLSDGTELDEKRSGKGRPQVREIADNPVKRAVEEFRALIDEMNDLRELLRAHGIPLRTTRMIVEFGVQNKPDKQAMAIDGAMEQAVKTMGEGSLAREVLENHIATIVDLEIEYTHVRSVAREEGLDAQALSVLTQMVQQSPGDGGENAVNTFLGYALALGVRTDKLTQIAGDLTQRPASVLPQVPRRADVAKIKPGKKIVQDIVVGIIIGVVVIGTLL